MRVECEIEEIELEGDHGSVPYVQATCSRCGHSTEAYGTSSASIRACLAMMRDECPEEENNFYVSEDDLDD